MSFLLRLFSQISLSDLQRRLELVSDSQDISDLINLYCFCVYESRENETNSNLKLTAQRPTASCCESLSISVIGSLYWLNRGTSIPSMGFRKFNRYGRNYYKRGGSLIISSILFQRNYQNSLFERLDKTAYLFIIYYWWRRASRMSRSPSTCQIDPDGAQ